MPDHLMIASGLDIAMHKNHTAMRTQIHLPADLEACGHDQSPNNIEMMKSGRGLPTGPFHRRRFLGLTTEAHRLRQCRACGGVVRGHHRIVRRKPPFGAVFVRRQAVVGGQMPLQRLKLLPVLQADDVMWRHLFLDGHCRLESFYSAIEGAQASGFADAKLHHCPGHDLATCHG